MMTLHFPSTVIFFAFLMLYLSGAHAGECRQGMASATQHCKPPLVRGSFPVLQYVDFAAKLSKIGLKNCANIVYIVYTSAQSCSCFANVLPRHPGWPTAVQCSKIIKYTMTEVNIQVHCHLSWVIFKVCHETQRRVFAWTLRFLHVTQRGDHVVTNPISFLRKKVVKATIFSHKARTCYTIPL